MSNGRNTKDLKGLEPGAVLTHGDFGTRYDNVLIGGGAPEGQPQDFRTFLILADEYMQADQKAGAYVALSLDQAIKVRDKLAEAIEHAKMKRSS